MSTRGLFATRVKSYWFLSSSNPNESKTNMSGRYLSGLNTHLVQDMHRILSIFWQNKDVGLPEGISMLGSTNAKLVDWSPPLTSSRNVSRCHVCQRFSAWTEVITKCSRITSERVVLKGLCLELNRCRSRSWNPLQTFVSISNDT